MARHNRWDAGEDQCGFRYRISYPPDWLDRIRVTRRLPGGRQSTKTLFKNPSRAPGVEAGRRVRARIESPEQDLEIEVSLGPDRSHVGELSVEWRGPGAERVAFAFQAFRQGVDDARPSVAPPVRAAAPSAVVIVPDA